MIYKITRPDGITEYRQENIETAPEGATVLTPEEFEAEKEKINKGYD